MPRGQYRRVHIPVHRFHITIHQADWPKVRAAARTAGMSVASFIRFCLFKHMGIQESERQPDRA